MTHPERDDMLIDENDYARPNQNWRCGWSDEGRPCPLGPSGTGTCRTAFECAPIKKADAWVCTRNRSRGGPCDDGPLPDGTCCQAIPPCQPKRTVLAKRKVVSIFACALAMGIVFFFWGHPNRAAFVDPGPLASHHSTIVHTCSQCHSSGDGSISNWLTFSNYKKAHPTQGALCQECHKQLGVPALKAKSHDPSVDASDPHALNPHSLDTELLNKITAQFFGSSKIPRHTAANNIARGIVGSFIDRSKSLSCSTCHQEHQGATFDLTAITNDQCQSCHAQSFTSLHDGHPDFELHSIDERSRIAFDHQSHFGQHFKSGIDGALGTDVACSACHDSDDSGRNMLVRNFEWTCASCHGEQIEDDTDHGFELFAVPAIDLDALAKADVNIGKWPKPYPIHVQARGRLAPLVELLLETEPGYADIRKTIQKMDLGDLRQATPEQLAAVEAFSWQYRNMLASVVKSPTEEIRNRLTHSTSSRISKAEVEQLIKLVPVDQLKRLRAKWFPTLEEELIARLAGNQPTPTETTPTETTPTETTPTETTPIDLATDSSTENTNAANPSSSDVATIVAQQREIEFAVSQGWYLRDVDLSLCYRPFGHADLVLHRLLNVSAKFGSSAGESADHPLFSIYRKLANPSATGRCFKCHTTDKKST
ncbi:MAG: hypothetical protein ACI9HK_004481, partial [Pirellulaceae bacterium]